MRRKNGQESAERIGQNHHERLVPLGEGSPSYGGREPFFAGYLASPKTETDMVVET